MAQNLIIYNFALLIISLLSSTVKSVIIPNCAITDISNPQLCKECISNYKLSSQKTSCIYSPNENCLQTEDDPLKYRKLCSQCICGFGLKEDKTCTSNSDKIVGCHQYNSFNQCKQCKPQFGLSQDFSSCLMNKNYTQNCFQYNLTFHCTQCQSGFGLTRFAKCILRSPLKQNFENSEKAFWVDELNAECVTGFKLDINKLGCYAVIANCADLQSRSASSSSSQQTSSTLTATCLQCEAGFLPTESREQCGQNIANCVFLDDTIPTICKKCANGFVPNRAQTGCFSASKMICNCQYPRAEEGECEQCYSGFGLRFDYKYCQFNDGFVPGCQLYRQPVTMVMDFRDFYQKCDVCADQWQRSGDGQCLCRGYGNGVRQAADDPGSCLAPADLTGIRDCVQYFSKDRCKLCKYDNEYRSPDWMYCSPYGDVPGCLKYWRINICRECLKGFGLTPDGLCVNNKNGAPGVVQHCKIYENDDFTRCLLCEDGWDQPPGPLQCGPSISGCLEYDSKKLCSNPLKKPCIQCDNANNYYLIKDSSCDFCITRQAAPLDKCLIYQSGTAIQCLFCDDSVTILSVDSLKCLNNKANGGNANLDEHCTLASNNGLQCQQCGLFTEDYGLSSTFGCINNMDSLNSNLISSCAQYDGSVPPKCTRCKVGFYLDNIAVKPTCFKLLDCAEVNSQFGDQCVKCNDNFALDSKKRCIDATNYNLGRCAIAKDDGTICNSCYNEYETVLDTDNKCINATNIVKYCISFSSKANPTNCVGCSLQQGYIIDLTTKTCQTIVPNCLKMASSTTCATCLLYYSSNGASCVKYEFHSKCTLTDTNTPPQTCIQCSEPYITIPLDKCNMHCFLLTASCQLMNDRFTCKQCWNPTANPTKFDLTADAKKCGWKPKNCLIVQSDRNCSQCNPSFYKALNSKNLYDCASYTVTNCLTYETYSDACLTCVPGYYIQQGKCIPLTAFPNCKTSSIIENKCTECLDSHYLVENPTTGTNCVLRSLSASSFCYPRAYNQDRCLSCKQGYIITPTFSCRPNTKMAYCREASVTEDKCLVCNDNFAITTNYECISNQPDGVDNCIKYKTKTAAQYSCLECANNFIISNDLNTCVPNCLQIDTQNQCTHCLQGYGMIEGHVCIMDIYNQNCAEFNIDQSSCISCQRGYGLTTTMKCVDNTKFVDNCAFFNQNMTCKQCHSGFIIKQGGDYCHFNKGCCSILGCLELKSNFNFEILQCNKCDEQNNYVLNNQTFLCSMIVQLKPTDIPEPYNPMNSSNLVNATKESLSEVSYAQNRLFSFALAFIFLIIQLCIVV